MRHKKNIGRTEVFGNRYSTGFAYVIIPSTIDRNVYIQDCYRTNQVSILTENGAYEHRVPVSQSALDKIQFPPDDTKKGSVVLWHKIMPNNKVVISEVFAYKDQWNNRTENNFLIKRDSGNAAVSITGDGNKGNLIINVEGNGLFDIIVSNENNEAQVNLTVQGNINVTSDGEINLVSESINHNDGSQAMVRGNYLKDEIIEKLLDVLLKCKVATSIGLQPLDPASLTELNKIKQSLDDILSKKSSLE